MRPIRPHAVVDDETTLKIVVWRDPRGRKCWEPNVGSQRRAVPDNAAPYIAAEHAEEEVSSRDARIEELEDILRTFVQELRACYDTLSVPREEREMLRIAKEALDGKLKPRFRRETARERRIRLRGW